MKKIVVLFISLMIVWGGFSQDCETWFPMKKGVVLEYTSYDAKERKTGRTVQQIADRNEVAGVLKADVKVQVYDEKDVELFQSAYSVKCDNGALYVDMNHYIDDRVLAPYQNMEMKMEGDFLEFPPLLKAGDQLADGVMKMTIFNSGVKLITIAVAITNRRVEAVENLTTSAGTYECFRISYQIETKTGFIKTRGSAKEWYSKNYGMIQSESFNKKGKMNSRMQLTAYAD